MSFARRAVQSYLVFIPWTALFVPSLTGHDYARLIEVLVCTVCGFAVAQRLWRTATPPIGAGTCALSTKWHRWLAVVVLLALAAVANAPVVTKALQELTLVVGLMAIVITVASTSHDSDVRGYWQAAILATLLYNSLALIVLSAGLINGYTANVDNLLGVGYDNRRFFNHVQTVALTLVAASLHQRNLSKRWTFAAWAALISGFSLLLLSGGRGTFVGIVGATLLSLLLIGRTAWSCVWPLVFGLLAGYLTYLLLFALAPSLLGLSSGIGLAQRAQDLSNARLYLWELARSYICESPWLGIGPMHYAYRPNLKASHPHNVFLQIAAEWGLPMLVMLLAGVVAGLKQMIRRLHQVSFAPDKEAGGLLLVACFAILIDGFVSGNFVMPVSQVWIAVCIGIAAQWARAASSPPPAQRTVIGVPWARPCAAMLGAAMLTQVVLLIRDFSSLDDVLKRSQALSISERSSPRYWIDGWFTEK